MSSPKILIVGFGDAMNYGGEAIVHGTLKMVFDAFPQAMVTVATVNLESAGRAFSGYPNVRIIQSQQRFSPYRVMMGLLRRVGVGSGSPVRMNPRIADGHDIVLSVGGDNFVQTPQKGISVLLDDLIRLGDRAIANGSFYCLWGASVGPFEDKGCFERVSRHLKKAHLIAAREVQARDYLAKLGCSENVVMAADPAFMMKPKQHDSAGIERKNSDVLIGVNLSRLALDYMQPKMTEQESIQRLAECVRSLLALSDHTDVVMIPHVMSSVGGAQDDFDFLSKLAATIDQPGRVKVLDRGLGSPATKAIMQQCDVIVAARMHCFVGSVSAGVPALMVAYSNKGYGMTQYVYGDTEYLIDIADLAPENLKQCVSTMLDNRQSIVDRLKSNNSTWQSEAMLAINALSRTHKEFLEDKRR